MSGNNVMLQNSTEVASNLIQAVGSVELSVHQRYLNDLQNGNIYDITDCSDNPIANERKVRFYKILSINYEQEDDVAKRFGNVFSAVASYNMTAVYLLRFAEDKVTFYLGTGSEELDSISTIYDTFRGAFGGNFPGCVNQTLSNSENAELLNDVFCYPEGANLSISAVSGCISESRDDIRYLEGMERLVDGMSGEYFDMIILAKAIPAHEIGQSRDSFEKLYSQISPFKQSVLTLSQNENLSYARSVGKAISNSLTQSVSHSHGKNQNYSVSESRGASKVERTSSSRAIDVGSAILSVAGTGILFAGGAFAQGATLASSMMGGVYMSTPISNAVKALTGDEPETISTTTTCTNGTGEHDDISVSKAFAESISKNESETATLSNGTGQSIQYTYVNKAIENLLADIEQEIDKLKQAECGGAFSCAAYFIAGDNAVAKRAASLYRSIVLGNGRTTNGLHINLWDRNEDTQRILKFLIRLQHPLIRTADDTAAVQAVSTGVLTPSSLMPLYYLMPLKPLTGISVTEHAQFSRDAFNVSVRDGNRITIGNLYHMGIEQKEVPIEIDIESLSMHSFITGTTGKGKSTAIYQLLDRLHEQGIHYLIIEPAKGEYKHIFGNLHGTHVYGTNLEYTPLLRLNPFSFPVGMHVLEHLDGLVEIFNMCWPMYAAMPAVLKEAIERAYVDCGWDLKTSRNRYTERIFPTFEDVKDIIGVVLEESQYSKENKGNYIGSLQTRLNSMSTGIYGTVFCQNEIDEKTLFDEDTIVDLSRVRSMETKALIMGILVLKLQEYRQCNEENPNQPLRHVTVLEEAHNLMKSSRVSSSGEGSAMGAKSVEMLANVIAEIRSYGEGFIIADQAPSDLDISVIRNTNTKIVMCLPNAEDRVITGKAIGLNDSQIDELAKLPVGVAAVYQNNWANAALMKVSRFERKTGRYSYKPELEESFDDSSITDALVTKKLKDWLGENQKKYRELVLKSGMSTKTKCMLCAYPGLHPRQQAEAYRHICYEYFHAVKVMDCLYNVENPKAWLEIVKRNISPSIESYDVCLQMQLLMALLCEQFHRDKKYCKIYYNYGEYLKKQYPDVAAGCKWDMPS